MMPSGRLVVTRNNAKSIRSMRAMFITLWYIAPGVSGAPAAMTTCRPWWAAGASVEPSRRGCLIVSGMPQSCGRLGACDQRQDG